MSERGREKEGGMEGERETWGREIMRERERESERERARERDQKIVCVCVCVFETFCLTYDLHLFSRHIHKICVKIWSHPPYLFMILCFLVWGRG